MGDQRLEGVLQALINAYKSVEGLGDCDWSSPDIKLLEDIGYMAYILGERIETIKDR